MPSSIVLKGFLLLLYWFLTYFSLGTLADLGIFETEIAGLPAMLDYLDFLKDSRFGGSCCLLLGGFVAELFDLKEDVEA